MIRLLAVAALLASLAACNTVEGFGRDLSAGGDAITGASNNARRGPPPVQRPRPTYIY